MKIEEMTYEELMDKYIRLSADFENFRKNKEIEVANSETKGVMSFLKEILTAIDSFHYVLTTDEGITISINKLFSDLEKNGVTFYGEVGEMFSEDSMEAISVSHNERYPKGAVLTVINRGCKYKDQIVRHAKVIVNI